MLFKKSQESASAHQKGTPICLPATLSSCRERKGVKGVAKDWRQRVRSEHVQQLPLRGEEKGKEGSAESRAVAKRDRESGGQVQ